MPITLIVLDVLSPVFLPVPIAGTLNSSMEHNLIVKTLVLEPPTAAIRPEQQTVGQGSSATFQCVTTGSPRPSVNWSKVGGELSENIQVHTMFYTVNLTKSVIT